MANDIVLAPGIVRNPERRSGKPVIAGTRITVEDILDRLANDWTIDDILHAFPHLTREQVLQAIGYATLLVRSAAPDEHTEPAEVSE